MCGSGVGTFIFAPLATWLLEQWVDQYHHDENDHDDEHDNNDDDENGSGDGRILVILSYFPLQASNL